MKSALVRWVLGLVSFVAVAFGSAERARADDSFPLGWETPGSMPGFNRVLAIAATPDGLVYAGGTFAGSDEVPSTNIGAWDNQKWAWSGVGSGTDGDVRALVVAASGTLFAGGAFTHAGGVATAYVASWNGSAWAPVGAGFDAPVDALLIDHTGTLYAGGEFTTSGGVATSKIARFDGTSWQPVDGGMDQTVLTLLDVPAGTSVPGGIYAGGYFTSAGSSSAHYIARLENDAWVSYGYDLDGSVSTLAFCNYGELYAAGGIYSYRLSPTSPAYPDDIAESGGIRNDGSAWFVAREGVSPPRALFCTPDDSARLLVANSVGTALTGCGGTVVNYAPPAIFAMAGDSAHSDVVYVGGEFDDGVRLAKCNCLSCEALPSPAHGGAKSLAHDAEGTVYLGGSFHRDFVNHPVVTWDGRNYHPLDPTDTHNAVAPDPFDAMAVSDAGDIYIALELADQSNVWHWDGAAWQELGDDFDKHIDTLALDPAGNLYAGGEFTAVGTTAVSSVTRWDGALWQPVGDGLPAAFALFPKSPSEVYAATVTGDGTDAYYIAALNDGHWTSFAEADGMVQVLKADPSGALYAGGTFTTIAGVHADHVARFDGAAWTEAAPGLSADTTSYADIFDLAFDDRGGLWIAGTFDTLGTGLVRWDGSSLLVASNERGVTSVTVTHDRVYAENVNGALLIHALPGDATGGSGGAVGAGGLGGASGSAGLGGTSTSGGTAGVAGSGTTGTGGVTANGGTADAGGSSETGGVAESGEGGADAGTSPVLGAGGDTAGTATNERGGTGGSSRTHGGAGSTTAGTPSGGTAGSSRAASGAGGTSEAAGARGGASGGGALGVAGASGNDSTAGGSNDAGCGCRTTPVRERNHGGAAFALFAAGLLVERRRSRRRASRA